MSYFSHQFVSPEKVFAEVKEDMISYLSTGMVDDSLFPIWTAQCLQKLGKSTFPVYHTVVDICGSESRLPDDFHAAKEVWACSDIIYSRQHPSAVYTYTTRLDTPDLYCNRCTECESPDIIKAIYKTTYDEVFHFTTSHLLMPGNVKTKENCNLPCINSYVDSTDVYSINDNKISVNFTSGKLYIVYYSNDFDCKDNQLIPDSYRIKEFIKAFLKQKLYERIFNMASDETFNQSLTKFQMYKQMADEAFILADTDEKKETLEKKIFKIRQVLGRNNKFHIP